MHFIRSLNEQSVRNFEFNFSGHKLLECKEKIAYLSVKEIG